MKFEVIRRGCIVVICALEIQKGKFNSKNFRFLRDLVSV